MVEALISFSCTIVGLGPAEGISNVNGAHYIITSKYSRAHAYDEYLKNSRRRYNLCSVRQAITASGPQAISEHHAISASETCDEELNSKNKIFGDGRRRRTSGEPATPTPAD